MPEPWYKGWPKAIAGMGGTVGNGFGAAMDWATGGADTQYDEYGRKRPSNFDEMLGDIGKTFKGLDQGTGFIGDGLGWLLKKDYELYSDYVSRPFSTFLTHESLTNSPTWLKEHGYDEKNPWDNFKASFLDMDAWEDSWRIAEHRSPGQAAVHMLVTPDIADPHEIEDTQRAWWFGVLSGSVDATTLWFLDPMVVGLKVGRVGKHMRPTKDLPSTLTRMDPGPGPAREPGPFRAHDIDSQFPGWMQTSTPMSRTLDWTQRVTDQHGPARAARIIEKHPVLRDNPHGGLIASMLATSSRGDKDLIMKIGLGDGKSYEALNATRGDLAAQLKALHDVRDDLIKVETVSETTGRLLSPAEKATNAERIAALENELAPLESRASFVDDLIGPGGLDPTDADAGILGAVDKLPRGGVYTKGAQKSAEFRGNVAYYSQRQLTRGMNEKFHFYNAFNSPVRVITGIAGTGLGKVNHFFNDQKPTGHLDTNDPEGWKELDNMLSRAKGLHPETRQEFVARYMRATSEGEKLRIANDAERAAITHVAQKSGLAYDDVGDIVNQFTANRNAFKGIFQNRAYSSATDRQGKRIDYVDSENTPTAVLPLLGTDLANGLPLADIDTVQRAFARHKNILKGGKYGVGKPRDALIDAADLMSAWWKTASLMRLGYMVRVLADDELAYIAKLDTMMALQPVAKGTGNFLRNKAANTAMRTRRGAYRTGQMAGYTAGKLSPLGRVLPGRAGAALQAAGGRTPEFAVPRELPPTLDMPVKRTLISGESEQLRLGGGTTVEVEPFAPALTKQGEYWRGKLTSEDRLTMDQAYDARMRYSRTKMAHGLVNQGDANFYDAWAHSLNNQLGQDKMAKQLLNGRSEAEVVQWLKGDPAGQAYARKLPFRSADPERWVSNVATFIAHYAPEDAAGLRLMAANGEVSPKLLKGLPHEVKPMQVHGELLAYNMGQNPAARAMNRIRERFYMHFNQIPTDTLVKHPLANALYTQRRNELISTFHKTGGTLNNQVLAKLQNQARGFTIHEINKVVLDLSHHSNAGHVFRFIAPFYNAWDKALRRWGRLTYGKPEILFRGNNLWQGANNIPMAIDKGGDVETMEGEVIHSSKNRAFTGIKNSQDQLLTFRMPKWMAKKLGSDGELDLDQVQIPKSSLNLILQGNPWWLPGFGPVAQVPMSAIVKTMPQHEELFKTVLPFGPQSPKELIAPTSWKKLGQWQDEDSSAKAAMKINIWRTRYAKWLESGRQGGEPDFNDPIIERDANRMFAIRFFAQMILPVNVRFTTPYKLYIDEYRKMLEDPNTGPELAHEKFIQKYPDYFMFAESISKNNARVPATVEAWQASKKHRELLAQVPDVAPVVLHEAVNPEAKYEFNATVYRSQFDEKLSPASSKKMREAQSLEEFATGAIARRGWDTYRKYADQLRVELFNRGLQSYQQKGAEDLAQVKTAVVEHLKKTNKQWSAEYDSFDAVKQTNIIEQLDKLTRFKPLEERADIQTLSAYMMRREQIIGELSARDQAGGSKSLTAVANRDLWQLWMHERDRLSGANTVFSWNIFDRYLEHDTNLTAA